MIEHASLVTQHLLLSYRWSVCIASYPPRRVAPQRFASYCYRMRRGARGWWGSFDSGRFGQQWRLAISRSERSRCMWRGQWSWSLPVHELSLYLFMSSWVSCIGRRSRWLLRGQASYYPYVLFHYLLSVLGRCLISRIQLSQLKRGGVVVWSMVCHTLSLWSSGQCTWLSLRWRWCLQLHWRNWRCATDKNSFRFQLDVASVAELARE